MGEPRATSDWIKSYINWTGMIKHEAPRIFHAWCGLSVLAACLERKVFYQLVEEPIYPNMFVILVAPPGACRKGGAIGIAKRFLNQVGVNYSSEKLTIEHLINQMVNCQTISECGAQFFNHSSLTVLSKELTVFLRVKDETFLPTLCDLYDCESSWTYGTVGRGEQSIEGVWLNLLGATVPPGLSGSIPMSVIETGLSSRSIFVYADKPACSNLKQVKTSETEAIKAALLSDLIQIHKMIGEYRLSEAAYEFLDVWYKNKKGTGLDYLSKFIERQHTHAIKAAMAIAAGRRDNLVVEKDDIKTAIKYIEEIKGKLYRVFGGIGRNIDAPNVQRIENQIRDSGTFHRHLLISDNLQHVSGRTFDDIIQSLINARKIESVLDATNKNVIYKWIGGVKK